MAKITPNAKQQECIDNINGKIMVLAGPGTGKTFTVIQRIKSMLERGIKPETILCLTFSDAAAGEMRERLIREMGVLASSVDIFTYHSFCNDIIKQNPMQFNLSANVKLISDTNAIQLMKEAIDEVKPEYFVAPRADKYHFVKDFLNYVPKLKSLRIDKDNYLSNIEKNPSLMPRIKELESEIYEREQQGKTQNKTRYGEIEKIKINIEKAKELWNIYEVYSDKMFQNNYIDFSDMINFVLDQFESDTAFLREVAGKYKYFLVDEYQDTNALQNAIIFNLLNGVDEKNIFVVGDDDQIIYGFQGAKSDNLENFLTKYPDTKVICLEENNRSAQNILDLSYAIISQDETRLENNELFKSYNISKKLTAKNQKVINKERKIRRWQFGDLIQEYNHIVDDIETLIKNNCPKNDDGENQLSQIAIISKKRAELSAFAELLEGRNIPYQIDEGKSIFEIRSSILIYFYMKALFNPVLHSDKLFGLLLAEPFNIDYEDYRTLFRESKINKKDFITNMRNIDKWKDSQKIKDFLLTFDFLREFAETNNLRKTLIELINRTGILEFFMKSEQNKSENIMGIKKILDEANELSMSNPTVGLSDFIEYLDSTLSNEIDITIDKNSMTRNAVQLVTYHGSKGREFEYVYLPNLTSRVWEDFRMPGEYKFITDIPLSKEEAQVKKDTELLKLLFVGITRAKYGLTLSFADNDGDKAQQITKFLTPVNNFGFENAQFEYNDEEFNNEFIKSISRETFDNRKALESEIKEQIKKIILSPSRLNDYIKCPRRFFYIKVMGIDIEDKEWDNANFGTAMHAVFENAVRVAKKNGAYPTYEETLNLFKKLINETAFSTEAKKEMFMKRGENALKDYYPHFVEIPYERVENIELSLDAVPVGDDFISGKIDRIEVNKDGTYELYDYKTGKPVNEKKVAPNEEKEGYYNQLCFYKYAFEKLTGKKVVKTGLIYVENHQKNVYKELTSEDTKYIENKIKEVYQNIKDLKFDGTCNEKNDTCKYCEYKQLCHLEIL